MKKALQVLCFLSTRRWKRGRTFFCIHSVLCVRRLHISPSGLVSLMIMEWETSEPDWKYRIKVDESERRGGNGRKLSTWRNLSNSLNEYYHIVESGPRRHLISQLPYRLWPEHQRESRSRRESFLESSVWLRLPKLRKRLKEMENFLNFQTSLLSHSVSLNKLTL